MIKLTMPKFFLALTLITSLSTSLSAAFREPASFTNGRVFRFGPGRTYDPGTASNVNYLMERALRQLSNAGGGRLVIYPRNSAAYRMRAIRVPSNCHVLVRNNTVIELLRAGSVFSFSQGTRNASVRGSGGRFTIRIPRLGGPNSVLSSNIADSGRAFILTHCDNIKIENVNIEDPFQTEHSSIEMTWGTSGEPDEFPRNVSIRNIRQPFAADYGYGVIQIQAAEDSEFENFRDRGGITLRLETGFREMTLRGAGGIFNVTGTNMMNVEGHCAAKLEPHAVSNGKVTLRQINSVSSGFSIYAVGGSLHRFDSGQIRRNNLTEGSFTELDLFDSRATYTRNKAPSAFSKIRFYEPSLFALLRVDDDNPKAGLIGPTAGTFGNYGGINFLRGGVARMRRTVRGTGFPSGIPAYTTTSYSQNRGGAIPR